MPLLTALALSIGILGGLATWALFGPLAAFSLQIWVAFIAWGAFYHTGGKAAALKSNIPAHILGAFLGWLALVGTTSIAGSLGVPVAAGICVGVTVVALVLAANLPLFAQIPSAVYGYACVAGYALLAGKLELLTSVSLVDNAFLNVAVAMVAGSLLGYLSQAIGVALSTPRAPTAAAA